MPKIEAIVKNPTKGGFLYEGPHYSSADGFLYYVDIIGNKIGRFDTKGDNGKNVWIDFSGESVTFVIPIKDTTGKELLIGQGKGVVHAKVDWDLAKVVEAKMVYRPKHQGKWRIKKACPVLCNPLCWVLAKFTQPIGQAIFREFAIPFQNNC